MAEAEVGDDGAGEDPTVIALEEAFAARLGKPAALLVPSGTMANQIALRLLGQPGTAVVVGRSQHIVVFENGAAAMNASIQWHLVDDSRGTLPVAEVQSAVDGAEHHRLQMSAVFVENTHMASSGTPWSLADLEAISAVGLPVHLDGARLFNAEVATGVARVGLRRRGDHGDVLPLEGLGRTDRFAARGTGRSHRAARGERKRFGGGMRQAGIIAAPGLIALER